MQDEIELGALVTLMYEGAAVAWVGGVLPEHQATNVNVLLYREMIQWAQAQAARTLDLVGIPDRASTSSRASFGGTRTPYTVLTAMAPGVRALRQLETGVASRRRGAGPAGASQPPATD